MKKWNYKKNMKVEESKLGNIKINRNVSNKNDIINW